MGKPEPLHLTPRQERALLWLQPGTWRRPRVTVARGLYSLATYHPDLCEMVVHQTSHGPEPEYRLTPAGEKARLDPGRRSGNGQP